MPSFTGINHLALTVSDLAVSVPFYSALWNSEPVGTMDDGPFSRQIFALPGGMTIGLTQHDHGSGKPFDAMTPGLDHIGFNVASLTELEEWAEHLRTQGISTDGVVEASYGTALSFKDPDGVALEFFVSA